MELADAGSLQSGVDRLRGNLAPAVDSARARALDREALGVHEAAAIARGEMPGQELTGAALEPGSQGLGRAELGVEARELEREPTELLRAHGGDGARPARAAPRSERPPRAGAT